jgi:hypothetical protein
MDPLLQALVTAGIIDADLANQVNRQSDPDAARAWAEELLFVAAQSDLSAQQQRLLSLLASTAYQPTETQLGAFWREEEGRFGRALLPALREVASEQAAVRSTAVARATGRDADQTFALINRQVLAWVDDYYINADGDPAKLGSLPNLTLTARTRFAQAFQEWQRGELEVGRPVGLPQLIDALTPAFGAVRAEAIAVTETTRLFTETLILAEHENEFTVAYRWLTAADELVCPRCSPRSNRVYTKKEVESGAVERPPIHTRDRCQLTPETDETLQLSKERAGSFGENAASRQVRQATAAEDDSGPVTVERAGSSAVTPAAPVRQPAAPAPQPQKTIIDTLFDEFAGKDLSIGTQAWNDLQRRTSALIREASTLSFTGQVHGMSSDVQFKGFKLGNQEIYWETPFQARDFVLTQFQAKQTGIDLPPTLSAATERIYFTSQANKLDAYWQTRYANFTSSLATGGDGNIVVYNNKRITQSDYAHESGHNLATKLYGDTEPAAGSKYRTAMRGEPPVSEYAKNSPSEDFAESVSQYVVNGSYMKQVAPQRYAAIDKIIKDGRE